LKKNEKGFSLIEVIIALALLGIIAVAFMSGLATASKAIYIADERATAENLARNQMEYVKEQTYADSYSAPIPDEYNDAGYSATIDTNELEVDLQEITVKIYHHDDAHANPPVITLVGYKVNR
jgi:prepilin-type N-terminal cleavage/methylation domain-containing protein